MNKKINERIKQLERIQFYYTLLLRNLQYESHKYVAKTIEHDEMIEYLYIRRALLNYLGIYTHESEEITIKSLFKLNKRKKVDLITKLKEKIFIKKVNSHFFNLEDYYYSLKRTLEGKITAFIRA